ncbi:hypothetical protein [Olleya sp. UBA1516]|uniref:hypothetical protein n=1 Tax=Olleya sp. UBA1516 TaxID=1947013 RepID=UPI0025F13AEC|nr:hypothetical protein [Olleya sp. UBA1516]|tara:strand:+ start:389 stop:1546 length:1158 start_codon:yes stop_codon:yes gene_type:complete
MSKKYNVLWIDDEHESIKAMHKTAIDFDITLFPFKSMNGGCTEFQNNTSKYDAILFDAKFFENETDEPGSEDTKWVHKAKDWIKEVDKTISFFVLTGQAEAYNSREFKNAFPYVFNKGVEEDEDNLFRLLLEACNNRELTKLKHKYTNPFEMCTDVYIGKKHFDRLHNLILDIENPSQIKIAQDSLTGIRKIIEAIFTKLNEIGCIPDEITQDKGWISGSSFFLSGKNTNYSYRQEIIHPVIAFNIFKILSISQDGSHNEGSKLGVDAYMASNSNTFLYQSTVLLLLDCLDWFKSFLDNNADKVTNESKWDKIQPTVLNNTLKGEVSRIADNGWGTFKDVNGSTEIGIPPAMVASSNLSVRQKVEIVTEPSPDGTKIFIKDIKVT